MNSSKKVLFLVPYPLRRAPSQRFRVELFLPYLDAAGISYKVQTFLDEATWEVLYQKGSTVKKAWGVIKGFLRRLKAVIFLVPRYDYVFIHREASPIGPPVFEYIIARLWGKRIIYDFDDAIWIPNTTKQNNIIGWVKAFWKVKYICKWSYKVVGGNSYLCSYAREFNKSALLIPTCVDIEKQHNQLKDQSSSKVVVGWTGSHSTIKFLDKIKEVLQRLYQDFEIETLIISNRPPDFQLPGLRYLPWQEKSEIEDLLQMNIGLMPLEEDPWCEGKCGFKLIQYFALGIPAVASPVGVNKEIVEPGVNGFLCNSSEDWYNSIAFLIREEVARVRMGKAGREKIIQEYSIQATAPSFLLLFT